MITAIGKVLLMEEGRGDNHNLPACTRIRVAISYPQGKFQSKPLKYTSKQLGNSQAVGPLLCTFSRQTKTSLLKPRGPADPLQREQTTFSPCACRVYTANSAPCRAQFARVCEVLIFIREPSGDQPGMRRAGPRALLLTRKDKRASKQ